jgi:hypothetical protein
MDDAAIVKLIWAQMSDDAIVNMINSHSGNYDTSADAIAALKKAGASQRIISAIIAKASASTPASTTPSSTPSNGHGLTCHSRANPSSGRTSGYASDRCSHRLDITDCSRANFDSGRNCTTNSEQ